MSSLQRPAFGQKIRLGTLYNSVTDTFQEACLLAGELPSEAVRTPNLHKDPVVTVSYDDTNRGKLDLLGISPDLGASFLGGLANPAGCGTYLKVQRKAANVLHAGVYHTMSIAEELLNFSHPGLRDHVDMKELQRQDATHFVADIEWGCQTVIVVRHILKEHDDKSQREGSFRQAVDHLKSLIVTSHYVQNPNLSNLQPQDIELEAFAYSETISGDGIVIQDLREAFDFIELLPTLLQQSNSSRGEPITYTLRPISMISNILGLGSAIEMPIVAARQDLLNKAVGIFDELVSARITVCEYSVFLKRYKTYVSPEHMQDVSSIVQDLTSELHDLKRMYGQALQKQRRDGSDRDLRDLVRKPRRVTVAASDVMDMAPAQRTKINFITMAVSNGAAYAGYNNSLDPDALLAAQTKNGGDAYMFKFSDAATADPVAWEANQTLLLELLTRKTSGIVVAVVDCDALRERQDRPQISHFQNGSELTPDLYQQRLFEAGQCFARYDDGALDSSDNIQKPVQRRMVKIPCPGSSCNSLQVCEWICTDCHSHVEFGYTDDFLYCDCGRVKFNRWKFKCNADEHGRGYEAYGNEAQLLSILKSLDQKDYVNILILGETGVGKSTFINSFVNYLTFDTLDDAKAEEQLHWVIPCSFSIQTMDRTRPDGAIEEKRIKVGTREDENDSSKGESATQQTAVYPVNIGSKTIRLIDTPGIGDTRGLAYDKKNMADILRTLSGYEHLHGILILLKSNNSRLTVTFDFCMKELLIHLHRSATQNMAFGFTNTRISNYSPGDTFSPLQTLLKQQKDVGLALMNQNTFCFDSESFRFLAAFKNGTVMENEEDFRRSWEHSRHEAVRLVKYFETRKPHFVRSTMSLNGTRQLIADLTKPMADISQTINVNIKLCKEQMSELQDHRLSGDKLRQRVQIEKVHLRSVKQDKPRTVCTNCCEYQDDGSGTVVAVYNNPCHDVCYLDDVAADTVAPPGLIRCAAFRGSNFCKQKTCGHHWQEHLHVLYKLEEYKKMVTDTEAERLFEKHASDTVVRQTAINNINELVDEYKAEHARIQEAAARFGIFLRKHSITPYNDATEAYLDMLIQDEEQKARISQNKAKLQDLRRDLNAHKELVKSLTMSMEGGSGAVLDEAGVESLVRDLYDLKHFGQMLKDVKNGISEAHQATYRERPYRIAKGVNHPIPRGSRQHPPQNSSLKTYAQGGAGGGGGGSSYDDHSRGGGSSYASVAGRARAPSGRSGSGSQGKSSGSSTGILSSLSSWLHDSTSRRGY